MIIPTCPFDLPPLPARSRDAHDIASHEAWFRAYAALEREACPFDPAPEDLKLTHTFKVLANARHISQSEGFAAPLARACLLAALYHDLARFAQYRGWHTFKDALSCNHGQLGAALLERYDVLAQEPFVRHVVIQAVAWHNAYALPEDLPEDVAMVTRVTRDADKIDILRVMDEHLSSPGPHEPTVVLSLPDDPAQFSQQTIDLTLAGKTAGYTDLTSVNDFRLLLGSWVNALYFPSARKRMASQGHAQRLLSALPDTPYGQARDMLLARLNTLA